MGIVAMIGLIFGPFVSLLFAAWFYVRWQNEEDEELALHNKKICFRALIAAAILLVVFGILKLIFPVEKNIKKRPARKPVVLLFRNDLTQNPGIHPSGFHRKWPARRR